MSFDEYGGLYGPGDHEPGDEPYAEEVVRSPAYWRDRCQEAEAAALHYQAALRAIASPSGKTIEMAEKIAADALAESGAS